MAPGHLRIADREAASPSSSDAGSLASTSLGRNLLQWLQRYQRPLLLGTVFLVFGLEALGLGGSSTLQRLALKRMRGADSELEVKVAEHPMVTVAVKDAVKDAVATSVSNVAANVLGIPTEAQVRDARESAVINQELREPEILRGPLTLTLQATKLPTPWIGGHFYTRGYGSIPGPTIRVRPGETLEITLKNDLDEGPGYESCHFNYTQLGFFMNPATICALNHTNLHTHGLHVSPHEDDIFAHVKPGQSKTMRIKVPENHMGGTHWYHPHFHHATAAQAGGGAHGALLVDDPVGALPKYVEEMPEKLMFLSLVNIAKSMRLESWGLDNAFGETTEQKLWKNPNYPNWNWAAFSGAVTEHGSAVGSGLGLNPELVVNGQWRPKVTIEEGKWHRFRFVFASVEQRVEIFPAGDKRGSAYCQYQLLAKDGIYLHEAPRTIERIYLVSGSRADIAVSCTCGLLSRPCHTHLNFEAKLQPMGVGAAAVTIEQSGGELLRIETSPPPKNHAFSFPNFQSKGSSTLQRFSVRRPCYLADLREVEVPMENRHWVDLPQTYPMKVNFDGKGEVWGHHDPGPLANIKVGEVQEWFLSGIRFHPFHLHINPYQIVQMWNDPYYMPGDWHDVILPTGSGSATVRLNIDRFTGRMIAHCHLLEHEDNGMMGYLNITGEEGTTWAGAHGADPQCYDGAFLGPPLPEMPPIWR